MPTTADELLDRLLQACLAGGDDFAGRALDVLARATGRHDVQHVAMVVSGSRAVGREAIDDDMVLDEIRARVAGGEKKATVIAAIVGRMAGDPDANAHRLRRKLRNRGHGVLSVSIAATVAS